VFERLLGPSDFETLRARGERARAMVGAGEDLAEVQRLALEVAADMDRIFSARSGDGISYSIVAARAAHGAGRRGGALRRLDGAIADLRAAPVREHRAMLGAALATSAAWLEELGRTDEAEARSAEARSMGATAPAPGR